MITFSIAYFSGFLHSKMQFGLFPAMMQSDSYTDRTRFNCHMDSKLFPRVIFNGMCQAILCHGRPLTVPRGFLELTLP